jgi:hypothetical protein
MYIFTRGRIQTKPVTNWLHGTLESWKAGQYQPFVDDVTGLIVSAEYNAQTTISGVPAMIMAHVKSITINYKMFVNPFATNAVKTTHIHSW